MIPNQFGNNDSEKPLGSPMKGLVHYVMDKVQHGRDVRDAAYGELWQEFTRIWRGFHTQKDKTTDSERSKLISPATQQAVEMTASEMEEATFGRTAWLDIKDDIQDQDKDDAIVYRDQLLEDFELCGVPEGIADTYLLGCVYGTGISKVNVRVERERDFTGVEAQKFKVTVEAVRPDEFVIDPSACSIEDALFCAHEIVKPKHTVKAKQKSGLYLKGAVESYSGSQKGSTDGINGGSVDSRDDGVLLTEYYGKVPAYLLPDAKDDDFDMVEAIVVIANETTVLKAVKSPFTMKDRPIVAYQHDSVPGQFWGRGVVEKGYNPQKALDAELRARIDALALMTAPMMGADITRMPRNPDLRTRPGRFFLTRGRPSEIIEPVGFNAPGLQATFQNASDLERMVSMSTGAMDSAIPIGQNRRNETSSGMSMQQAGFLKRSKRTMRRVEKYLDALVTKSLWRYMQFDKPRYPQDIKFKVSGTIGIMAREVENQQLVQMLGFVPPESPAHGLIIQALFENTNSADKDTLKQAIQQMNQPPSEEEQAMQQKQQQLQMQMAELQVAEMAAKVAKLEADAKLAEAKTVHEYIDADLEDDRLEISAANAATGAEKARQAALQNQVNMQKVQVEAMKARNDQAKRSNK
jgi:hypothetical protein